MAARAERIGRPESSPKAGVPAGAYLPDARARAIQRGLRLAQETLRAAGGAFGLSEVRELLGGVSRQAINRRVQEGSLLAVPGPQGALAYPTLQFQPGGGIVAGIREALHALPVKNGWARLDFLANPNDSLGGRSPIDVLRQGDVGVVVEAARRVGEQGG